MQTQTFFQKYELSIFFLLAYLLSWWSTPFADGGIIPHGPALAVVIVIALTAGKQGSIPAVMVFYYTSNLLTRSMMLQVFSGSERRTYYILFVVFACLIAITILWKTQFRPGRE